MEHSIYKDIKKHETKYVKLDSDIEAAIIEDKKNHWINPEAFCDEDIVRREENSNDQANIIRTAFDRDIEKILYIPPYNRCNDKTQVFSLYKNDDITRRGLHVQMVSKIARNIGSLLGLNTRLIEAIALGHDVGHTPFGHAGERFLSKIYCEYTGRYFNHNVHSVRVLDQLYKRNLSLQTLDGVLCHNGEFEQQILIKGNMKTFDELDLAVENCTADEKNIEHLQPSTLEGCVVRISDIIAYLGRDRIDARNVGVIDSLTDFTRTETGLNNTEIINNLVIDIVNNSYRKKQIQLSEEMFEGLKLAKYENYTKIYNVEAMEKGSHDKIGKMFVKLYDKILQDCLDQNEESPLFKHHINSLTKLNDSISKEEYLKQEPNQIVVDYIASMTDSYFVELYKYLFKTDNIAFRGYFT